jgi:GH15 family glucan-1,4-alpha-glucosidase
MPSRIEDYAVIADTQTAALVGRDGSIDWLCLPRFDSGACFAVLLGDQGNGHWRIAPAGGVKRVRRRYQGDTLVLETEFETGDGVVRVVDFMAPRMADPDVVRVVEGVRGRVPMRMEPRIRFDYGRLTPWVRRVGKALLAISGPEALLLRTPVEHHGEDRATVADFQVAEGDRLPFTLTWNLSHQPLPDEHDPLQALADTRAYWEDWAGQCTYRGQWRDPVMRSLLTLKALTYQPSGGIVAAATTSLPEAVGGVRNWDYRFCWLRDATMTLTSLMAAGYEQEARDWREWLLRAMAGDPPALQIMYGPAGEARLPELELEWLDGYEGSKPVRTGNAAIKQFQIDVYGEVMDALHKARQLGLEAHPSTWALQRALLEFLEANWQRPDEGSGRSGGRGATSPTPRSWPGWPWTGRSRRSRSTATRARWTAGGGSGTRSTARSASRPTTPTAGPSPSPTGRGSWTPACSSSPWSGSCPRATRGSGARSRPSSASWSPTGSCSATPPAPRARPWTGSRAGRGPLSPAPSGWPTTTP